jgi:hypothetical protein
VSDVNPADARLRALDRGRSIEQRVKALEQIADRDPAAAKDAILQLCARHDEPELLLRAAGSALARLRGRGVDVTPFDLRDISPIAWDAWDRAGQSEKGGI